MNTFFHLPVIRLMLVVFVISIVSTPDSAVAQMNQDETFGKNRVQYHKDFKYWWKYETANFITYWYSPARKAAEAAILMAEDDYTEIRSLLEHHITDKIQLIVFKDITDFKQSNLGTEEVFEMSPGTTKVDGNRVFVYANDDHNFLRHQIREGIASVHIAQMLQGNTLQEMVQNAFQTNLPAWYVAGLISYVGSPYDYAFESKMRAYLELHPNSNFEKFAIADPTLAGHALWQYIYTKYGATNLSNLLYITRINRKLDNGFIYVLGRSMDDVTDACYAYYKTGYQEQLQSFAYPENTGIKIKGKRLSRHGKNKYNMKISDVVASPDGNTFIYVTNELGRYKVWEYDVASANQRRLIKGNFRNPFQEADMGYPLLDWEDDSRNLFIVEEKRDKLFLERWNRETGEKMRQPFPPKLQRIYSMDVYSPDTLLLSASVDGYTDLFFYRPKTRQLYRLTEDYFDDTDARTLRIGNSKYIVFSSNRLTTSTEKMALDTILPATEFDLYLMSPRTGYVQRLTETPWASERSAQVVGTEVHYISDETGIKNRWKIDVAADQLEAQMLTQYKSGINDFAISDEKVIESIDLVNDVELRWMPLSYESIENPMYTQLATLRRVSMQSEEAEEEKPVLPILPSGDYPFQSPYAEEIPLPANFGQQDVGDENLLSIPTIVTSNSEKNTGYKRKFNPARMLAYRMTFGVTDFDVDLNNDVLFTGLNTFAGQNNRGFEIPEVGILMRTEMRDLFENYVISGGARIPLSFTGSEFYLSASDRKFQLDRTFSIYRQSFREREDRRFEGEPDTRNTIHIGVMEYKYPFSIFSSVSLAATLRFDRTTILPQEASELNLPNDNKQRVGLRFEYVFDNTYQTLPNILHGTRAKFYVEGMNRFKVQFNTGDYSLSDAFMTNIGVDVRHYIRLDRHSILAGRFAGATSLGSEKTLFYMGGVRNWISADYNNLTPPPLNNNFAFQAQAADMRGFQQNIRNGTTYLLGNTELRIPFFNYFSRGRIKSRFFRNFQLIGFFDIGTAWHGSSPNGPENSLNREILSNPAVTIDVQYFRDPLIIGYGAGARLHLLGYYMRLDYAWGIETRRRTDPIFYFSLGHDF